VRRLGVAAKGAPIHETRMNDESSMRTHLVREHIGRTAWLIDVDGISEVFQQSLDFTLSAFGRFTAHGDTNWTLGWRVGAPKLYGFCPHPITLPPPPGGASAREGDVRMCHLQSATALISCSCVQLPQQP
jgi:hypothetical protein